MTADEITRSVAATYGDRPELMLALLQGALGGRAAELRHGRCAHADRARPALAARRRLAALTSRTIS